MCDFSEVSGKLRASRRNSLGVIRESPPLEDGYDSTEQSALERSSAIFSARVRQIVAHGNAK
jgi:hypothetical protein